VTKEMNNRQAYFNYAIEDKYIAGVALMGTEVKSIREGKVSFNDAFCLFDNHELWVRGLYIAEYKLGTTNNHISVHDRKLLLHKKELKKMEAKIKEKGFTIVPLKVFFTDEHFVKIEIGLGRGKKDHDKRQTIKERDSKKEIKQYLLK
jgi:SsrA-binding protein